LFHEGVRSRDATVTTAHICAKWRKAVNDLNEITRQGIMPIIPKICATDPGYSQMLETITGYYINWFFKQDQAP
jgi:hypothetical protein